MCYLYVLKIHVRGLSLIIFTFWISLLHCVYYQYYTCKLNLKKKSSYQLLERHLWTTPTNICMTDVIDLLIFQLSVGVKFLAINHIVIIIMMVHDMFNICFKFSQTSFIHWFVTNWDISNKLKMNGISIFFKRILIHLYFCSNINSW